MQEKLKNSVVREPCGKNLVDFLTWLFQLLGISQVCVLCKKWKVADERIFISIGRTPWLCEYDDHYMAIITKCSKGCHRRQGWQNIKKSLISVHIHSCQFMNISCLSIWNWQGWYNRYFRHSLGCKMNPHKYYSSWSFSVWKNCKPKYHLHEVHAVYRHLWLA